MIGFWLGCLLALAPAPDAPRLEAALVVPRPAGIVLDDQNVQHYAQQGLTLLPELRPESVTQLTDGTTARFVTFAQAQLGPEPARLRLPLGGQEIQYEGRRDGRSQQYRVLNPAAIEIECRFEPAARGAKLGLGFTVTQLAAQNDNVATNAAGEPLFLRNQIAIEQLMANGETLLALFASDGRIRVGGEELELMYRQQVVNQTVEATAPLIGVLLRLVPAGQPLRFDQLSPPIAPPGQVAVEGAAPQAGAQRYQEGLTADQALSQAGVDPRYEQSVKVRRMDPAGNLDEYALPNAEVQLQDRDVLVVGAEAAAAGPSGQPVPPAETLPPGAAGTPGTAGAAAPSATSAPDDRQGQLLGSYLLDELRQIAPAAAAASKAAVALRGTVNRKGQDRAFLMAGTLVRPDGLLLAAPAAALDGVTELRATLQDGRELTATRIGTSSDGSLVALRVTGEELPFLSPSGYRPPAGVPVVVVGHPYGLDRTVTITVVAGPPRDLPAAPGASLQLDGALAAGNSGGPVVDLSGRLVGLAYGNLRAGEPGPQISLAVAAEQLSAFLATLAE